MLRWSVLMWVGMGVVGGLAVAWRLAAAEPANQPPDGAKQFTEPAKQPPSVLSQVLEQAKAEGQTPPEILNRMTELNQRLEKAVADKNLYALKTFGRLDEPTRQILRKALKDKNHTVRFLAVVYLGQAGDPAIAEALEDEAPDIRAAAAQMLGGCKDPKVIPALRKALSDPKNENFPVVRASAVKSLGQLQDQDSLPLMCRILKDKNQSGYVRQAAAEALGLLNKEPLQKPEHILNFVCF